MSGPIPLRPGEKFTGRALPSIVGSFDEPRVGDRVGLLSEPCGTAYHQVGAVADTRRDANGDLQVQVLWDHGLSYLEWRDGDELIVIEEATP